MIGRHTGLPRAAGDTSPWLWLTAGILALLLGALVGRDPLIGVAAVIGLVLMVVLLADLTVGVITFVAIQFLGDISSIGVGQLSGDRIAGALVLGAWIIYVATTVREERPRLAEQQPVLTTALVLFILWGWLSVIWATSAPATYEALPRYALNFVLVPIIFSALRRPRHAVWYATAYVLGACFAGISGILSGSGDPDDLTRAAGTLGDPNALAAALVPAILLGAVLAIRAQRTTARFGLLVVVAVCTVALFQTLSRGGLLALGVALIALTIFGGRWRPKLAVGGLAAVLTTVMFFLALASPEERARVTDFRSADSGSNVSGGTGRTDIWRVGLRAFDESPFAGVGLGNFTEATPRYLLQPGLVRRSDLVITTPKVAHNTFIEVMVETGVVGLALFGTLIVGLLAAPVRAAREFARLGMHDLELLSRALFAGALGMLAANLFISGQLERTFWLVFALGPALLGIALAERARRTQAGAAVVSRS